MVSVPRLLLVRPAHEILEELVTFAWPMPSLTLVILSLSFTRLRDEAWWMSILGLADHLSMKDGALAAGHADALFLEGATVTRTLASAITLFLGPGRRLVPWWPMRRLVPWLVGVALTVGLSLALLSAVHLPIVCVLLASACESGAACRIGIEPLTSVHERLKLLLPRPRTLAGPLMLRRRK